MIYENINIPSVLKLGTHDQAGKLLYLLKKGENDKPAKF